MSPIFKNYSDSAQRLTDKIAEEGIATPIFTYINPEAKGFCQLISPGSTYFFDLRLSGPTTLVFLDDGSTRASEFVEYTDQIRQKHPQIQIIIAIPVIPQSEEEIFKANCDCLLTLHIEPLFFSINQFYQENQS